MDKERQPSSHSGHTKHGEQVEHQHKWQVMTAEAHESPHHPPPRPGRHRQRGVLCKHYIKLRRQARKNSAHLSGRRRYLANIGSRSIWPIGTKHDADIEGILESIFDEERMEMIADQLIIGRIIQLFILRKLCLQLPRIICSPCWCLL